MHVTRQRELYSLLRPLCDWMTCSQSRQGNLLDSGHNLFPLLLATPNKQMPRLLPTTLNPHKLVKLQDPPLAACPAFSSLVKQCLARVMHALILPQNRRGRVASSATADGVWWHGQSRVVGFGLRWRWWFGMCLWSLMMLRDYGNSRGGSRAIRNAIFKRGFY